MHRLKHIKLNSCGRKVLRQRLSGPGHTNFVGGASALALALLALVTLSPTVSVGANAETVATKLPVEVKASQILSLALDHNSVYMGEVSPTKDGSFTEGTVKLTAETNAMDGYKLYINTADSSTALTKISEGISSIPSISTMVDQAHFPKDQWGYSITEGSTSSTTYQPIKAQGSLDDPVVTTAAGSKDYTLSFAAKLSSSLPAGTYRNTMMVSAVTNPETIITLDSITTMQEMNHQVCENTLATNAADLPAGSRQIVTPGHEPSKQLRDTRDNKWYWVSKLADQNCWMTQNLDLDIPATISAEFAAQSDNIAAGWVPTAGTIKDNNFNVGDDNTSYSWDAGNYRITNPLGFGDCSATSGVSIGSACSSILTATANLSNNSALGDENLHYMLGNLYQFNAAIASSSRAINTTVNSSICPKQWTLPRVDGEKSFETLLGKYSLKSGDSTLGNATFLTRPLYFVRNGNINLGNHKLHVINDYGSYLTASIGSTLSANYYLSFSSTISAHNSGSSSNGRGVRCVAR